jgi:hypothetical protein
MSDDNDQRHVIYALIGILVFASMLWGMLRP